MCEMHPLVHFYTRFATMLYLEPSGHEGGNSGEWTEAHRNVLVGLQRRNGVSKVLRALSR